MLRERNYGSALCLEVCECLPNHPFDFASAGNMSVSVSIPVPACKHVSGCA